MSETKMNEYRHFFLYAKYHYEETDVLEDMKKIQANWSGCEPEDIYPSDIISVLSKLAYKYIIKHEYLFNEFIKNIDPDKDIWWTKKTDDRPQYMRTIEACLSVLRFRSVDEIEGSLGEADPNILPLSEGALERMKERELEASELRNKLESLPTAKEICEVQPMISPVEDKFKFPLKVSYQNEKFEYPKGHEKCRVSSTICDTFSFGRGRLDDHGFWSIPCPECARAHEKQFPEDGECWPFSRDSEWITKAERM